MLLSNANILFLDCQSTGASPAQGELLEIGWQNGDQLTTYIHAVDEVPRRITRITGITTKMARADGVPLEQIHEELRAAVESADVLVIHYAQFEKAWIRDVIEDLEPRWICTHKLAQRLLPTLPRKGIRAVSGFLGEPIDEAKRSSDHVEATIGIWNRFTEMLKARGIRTLDEVEEFVSAPAPKSKERVFPLPREVRLAVPETPGVYRFLAADRRILYVGKATDLKSRVNSYYRGKKKAEKTLELLSQVYHVDTIETQTALEAVLLESAQIKEHEPPYNVQQRSHDRQPAYLDAATGEPHDVYQDAFWGPFASRSQVDSIHVVRAALEGNPSLLQESEFLNGEIGRGVAMFDQRFESPRRLEEFVRVGQTIHFALQDHASDDQALPDLMSPFDMEELADEEVAVVRYLAWSVASFYRATTRGQWLQRLAVASIEWEAHTTGENHRIDLEEPQPTTVLEFDRLSALLIELQRVVRDGRKLTLTSQGERYDTETLAVAFRSF